MVFISETSDDGSNGGDPNKKPKEVKNQNKKLKEMKNQNKKLKEKVSSSSQTSLPIPDELIETCFAMVRRCDYPTLSLVCRHFRDLIASPELYRTRSRHGYTESVLYAYIRFLSFENPSWYILHRKPYRNLPNTLSLKLCKIDNPLPPMPPGCAVVTIGSEIYVIGGSVGETSIRRTTNVTLVDFVSHKYLSLPRMKVARCHAAAGVIDGKLYVIGGCEMRSLDWVEAFDLKEQTWNPVPGPYPKVNPKGEFVTYAVMNDMIYIADHPYCYAYEPTQAQQWNSVGENILSLMGRDQYCVIDDMLFCFNRLVRLTGYLIIAYDPKENKFRFVQGLEDFPACIFYKESKMANFGGKLVILGCDKSRLSKDNGERRIWCLEIGLEKRQGGKIWGKVESFKLVLTVLKSSPSIELCRTVTV